MVFEDVTVTNSDRRSGHLFVAVPSDRFLSLLFDFILVLPFVYFLSSPVMRRWNELSFWGGAESQFLILSAAMALLASICFFIYQTTCWWVFRATAGQHILRLQVLTHDQKSPTLSQSLLRAFLWWLSLLLLAFPFFECLFHKKGFCLHDKGSETAVFTDQEKLFRSLSALESSVLRISFGLFGFSTLLLVGALVGALMGLSQKGGKVLSASTSERCDEMPVSGPADLWSSQEAPFSDWAISLYLAKVITSDCLESLADDGLWGNKHEDQSYAYFAKALLENRSQDTKQKYLNATCEGQKGGQACRMARLERAAMSGNPSEIQSQLHVDFEASSLAYKFLILKHRDAIGANQILTAALKAVTEVEETKSFVASHTVKNLWQSGTQERARGALSAFVSTLGAKEQLDELAWFCVQERNLECSPIPVESCLQLNTKMIEVSGSLKNKSLEFAQVVDHSCRKQNPRSLASLTKSLHSPQAKKYVIALAQARMSGRHTELHRVMNDPESIYQREAMFQLSTLPVHLKLVKHLLSRWNKQMNRDLLWQRTGQNLIEALVRYRQDESLVQVASTLEGLGHLEIRVLEPVVSVLSEAGHRNQAYSLLQKHWTQKAPNTHGISTTAQRVPAGGQRMPAASSGLDFQSTLQSLTEEFGPL